MAVKYVLVERGNPGNPEAPKKWYAQARSAGDITLKALSKEIAQRSTVSSADTLAVLDSLTAVLCERLAEGQIVRFGDFGSFQVSIGSDGAEKAEKFNANMIRSRKIMFRPGADLREMLAGLKFAKEVR